MIQLCVFDVDGTLVTKGERHLSESTLRTLHTLKKKGIKLAIASGRPPFAMEKRLLEAIDFDYFICSNGACVLNGNGDVLRRFQFTQTQTQHMIDVFKETDNALMFQCDDAAHCYHGYKRIAGMLETFLGRLDILVDEREHETYEQPNLPLAAVAKIEEQDIASMKKAFPDFLFTPFENSYYDINGAHSKADGIAVLCKQLHCTMQEVAAFGDDFNDLEMLKQSGYGIAMGNARAEVKHLADYVTNRCEEDGIANACKHFGWLS